MTEKDRIRIAVVGAGGWGKNLIRVFSELGECRLAAICDKDEDRAKYFGQLYKVPSFTDIELLMEKEDIDAVAVATPTPTHYEVATRVIRAEKHVFVEKPICDSSTKARKLIEEASKRGVKLMVGHIERFNPAVRKLKEIMDAGRLGRISLLMARRVGHPVKLSEVGVIKDLAIHDIDIMRFLTKREPNSVFAVCGSTQSVPPEDFTQIMMTFENILGYIEANWLEIKKERLLLAIGDEAAAILDYLNQGLIVRDKCREESVPIDRQEPLKLELSHFLDCIIEDKEPLVAGMDGLRALEIAERCLQSAMMKKPTPI